MRACGALRREHGPHRGPAHGHAGGLFPDAGRGVLELAPENVTVHTLSLKRGSGLALAGRRPAGGGEVRLMLDESMARLRAAGYAPYYLYRQKNMAGGFENTGWARPGFENLYNICIMEGCAAS